MIVNTRRRALVLHLRDPSAVLNLIPTAKPLIYKGHELTVVPHRLDVVRLLRNLGLDPPHPVDYYYNWPGRYTPLDAQRETVRFLTLHPRAYCLNDLGCVDANTEYLSPEGWKRIDQYQGDAVAQYWPDSGTISFVDSPEYVKLPCDNMVRIKTKYGLDQLLSPEHRVLLHSRTNPDKQEVVSAVELLRRHELWRKAAYTKKSLAKIGYSEATIPVTFRYPDAGSFGGIPMTDAELRVMCAVIADGHFNNSTARVVIRLKKTRKIERLHQLLQQAGIEYAAKESTAPTAQGYVVFSFVAPQRTKEFGPAYWCATEQQRAVVADEVLHWDGSVSDGKPTRRFSSSSRASTDYVQYVFASLGYTARAMERLRLRNGKAETEYEVSIRDNGKALQIKGTTDGERRASMWLEPSTDGYKYCFQVPSTFLLLRRNGCIFATGNTGKTLSALWSFDFLRTHGQAQKLLVIAPLSTLERTWGDELFSHFPHLNFHVLHGTSQKRRLLLADKDVDVYIINHDGVKVIQDDLRARQDLDTIIIDELAQVARNAQTDRWKSLRALTGARARIWGMTGTPTPNAPTDAWAQARLLTPSTVPTFFSHFRDMTMRQTAAYTWIVKDDANDIVHQALQPAIRFRRDDCIDLPPVTYETREVALTKDQQGVYDQMLAKLYAEYQGGEITAVNEAVKTMKLVQICCGAAYDSGGNTIVIPPKGRVQELLTIIEEAASKVIIFVPFKSALKSLHAEISKHYSAEMIYGEVSKSDRDRILGAFQQGQDPQVLVAQPAAMSHGLTLTAASVIVWFAPITSAETYEQANARITRPGQRHNQLIVHIQGTRLEGRMYDRLKKKVSLQGTLLEMFRDQGS